MIDQGLYLRQRRDLLPRLPRPVPAERVDAEMSALQGVILGSDRPGTAVTRRVVARHDASLSARVVRSTPLKYAGGADPLLDRSAHVRAGSGLVWAGPRLMIVQDDANFVALVDPASGTVTARTLPAGDGGRRQFDDASGNKAHKLDLEAVVSIPPGDGGPLAVAFGSGSTSRRERVVTLRGVEEADGHELVAVHAAAAFYEQLRASIPFAGSELNIEGAVYLPRASGGRLRLFNRGNGARRAGVEPTNATCDVEWRVLAAYLACPDVSAPPHPTDVVQYDLGVIGGLALTFTDASVVLVDAASDSRWTLYTAAAEASPDATRDGPVAGVAVGVIAEGGGRIVARWALLRDQGGDPFMGKVEGIALRPDDPGRGYLVVDRDAHDVASELCEVVLEGAWLAPV